MARQMQLPRALTYRFQSKSVVVIECVMPFGRFIARKDGADIDAVIDSILRERTPRETSYGRE